MHGRAVSYTSPISTLWNRHFPKVIHKIKEFYGKTLPRTCFEQWTLSFSFPLCKGLFIKCWRCSFKFIPEVLHAAEISDYSRHQKNPLEIEMYVTGYVHRDPCRVCVTEALLLLITAQKTSGIYLRFFLLRGAAKKICNII